MSLRLPAIPQSVVEVRRAIAELGLPPPVLAEAKLLASELVTNSIRHSGLTPQDLIRVTARWSGQRLRVDVFDRVGPREGIVAGGIRPSPGAESGWGLFLVEELARRWGNAPGHYWFEVGSEPD